MTAERATVILHFYFRLVWHLGHFTGRSLRMVHVSRHLGHVASLTRPNFRTCGLGIPDYSNPVALGCQAVVCFSQLFSWDRMLNRKIAAFAKGADQWPRELAEYGWQ